MVHINTSALRRILDEVALLAPVVSMTVLRRQVPAQLMRLVSCERAGWLVMNRVTGVMSGYHVPEMLPHIIPLMPRDLGQVALVPQLIDAPSPTSRSAFPTC